MAMNKPVFVFLLIIIPAALLTGFVFFQMESQVSLSAIDLSDFPRVSFLMNPWDASGNFILGLEPEDMLVIENEQEIEVDDLQEMSIGAQIVIAHNDGAAFTVSGEDEIPRSEIISGELISFFKLLDSETADSIGIVTPDGILLSGQHNKNLIIATWEAYEHDFVETRPNLNVLSLAIDLASDPVPVQGMGKAVLLLTPLIKLDQAAILQDLVDRAVQSRIRIHVGFIGRVADFDSEEAANLKNVADQTGGQYFAYSLEQEIPDFNSMFESSRRIYQVLYTSQVKSTGLNQFSVLIDTGTGNVASEVESFEINVQPPNPIFLSLPGSIERYFPEDMEILLRNLEPKKFQIEILIDFPDKNQREIVQTNLYVDGELTFKNTGAPFDQFTLNINKYQQETRLILKVTAEDELGLVGESVEIPIMVVIKDPAYDFGEVFSSNVSDLAVVVLVSALGIGILILVLSGRIRPLMQVERLHKRAKKVNITDQDLENKQLEEKEVTGPLGRIMMSGLEGMRVTAELQPVDAETGKDTGGKHNIMLNETYIGSDISKVQMFLDDPALDEIHSLIRREESGRFFIMDIDSTAGTWLNYDPVSTEMQELKHGDLVHIGTTAFRFQLPGEEHDPEIEIRYIDDGTTD